jgi:serine/threonine protein kinase
MGKGGEVKLLDFGIAKLLDPETRPSELTLSRLPLLTPEYASPEQAGGDPITTASDVYSLGVVLYELPTGGRPYRLDNPSPREIARVITETEPEPPSIAAGRVVKETNLEGDEVVVRSPEAVSAARASSPDRLRRQLQGDLDNIALATLRKEPEERYPSAAQLIAGHAPRPHRPRLVGTLFARRTAPRDPRHGSKRLAVGRSHRPRVVDAQKPQQRSLQRRLLARRPPPGLGQQRPHDQALGGGDEPRTGHVPGPPGRGLVSGVFAGRADDGFGQLGQDGAAVARGERCGSSGPDWEVRDWVGQAGIPCHYPHFFPRGRALLRRVATV